MTANTDRPGIAEKAAGLKRPDLEGLFIGVVNGLLSEQDRRHVDEALARLATNGEEAR